MDNQNNSTHEQKNSDHPNFDDYKFFIDNEWKDIHHSRIQEWSALGVIAGIHIGIIQLIKFVNVSFSPVSLQILVIIGFFCGILFSILGGLITLRHRRLMWIKLNWIFEAEDHLGLIKDEENLKGIIPRDAKMKKNSFLSKELYKKEESNPDKKNQGKSFWNKLMWPRLISTSWLILAFYFLLIVFDLVIIIMSSVT